jgi:hypothetical protein
MARQISTTMINTFLVRSLIDDFPKRRMVFGGAPVSSWPGLAEHQRPRLVIARQSFGFPGLTARFWCNRRVRAHQTG